MKNKEAIESLQKEMKSVKSTVDGINIKINSIIKGAGKKPQFGVGKWWVDEGCSKWLMKRHSKTELYGFNTEGGWVIKSYSEHELDDITVTREATRAEVEAALVKEAEKRGFVKGVKVIPLNHVDDEITTRQLVMSGDLDWIDGVLADDDGGNIFFNGKWAEIVEEEKEEPKVKGEIFEACKTIDVDLDTFFTEAFDGYITDANGHKYKFNKVSLDPEKDRAIVWYDVEIVEDGPRWTLEDLNVESLLKKMDSEIEKQIIDALKVRVRKIDWIEVFLNQESKGKLRPFLRTPKEHALIELVEKAIGLMEFSTLDKSFYSGLQEALNKLK